MSQKPKTIAKLPALPLSQDFYQLRRAGVGFIEELGSRWWTDYNTHDPGITILEALCYALTDLAYRAAWDVKDLLTPEIPVTDAANPFPGQAFFTAREILTVNPTTPDDFRRLLIDLDSVRNAWVFGKECTCETGYYAWCDKDELRLAYQPPSDPAQPATEVTPLGLYEARLELEGDVELGDLNDRKIERKVIVDDVDGIHPLLIELRFPENDLADSRAWAVFLGSDEAFGDVHADLPRVTLSRLGATKAFDVFSDPSLNDDSARDAYLRAHWRGVFFLDIEIEFAQTLADQSTHTTSLLIRNAALRVFGADAARFATTTQHLRDWLEDRSAGGFIQRYRRKAKAAIAAVDHAKAVLNAHRSLDEDFCRVEPVGVEDVAVCADVEVKADADIEAVQARIWFEIEQYFNPAIRFLSLQELLDAGERVEDIFNGPALANGFIQAEDLQAASLKSVLRTSDIINRLMEIEGVLAINQLLLTKYDSEGQVIKGAADPAWNAADGKPIFDANKASASWLLFVSRQHQPRLYRNVSRFLFYKDGLPFMPRSAEVEDALSQLRGEAERPKNPFAAADIDIPKGSFRHPEDYQPLQYSFPQTYGIGLDGLPSNVSPPRRAQAKQLKAYLMVFEQVLGNTLAQLGHTADLFSLDPEIRRTYFVKAFSESLINGFDEITKDLDQAAVEAITESEAEFLERRNRFLDHLLARFGEQFSEYALLLSKLDGRRVALERLINDKISFLKAYPQISHDRARAFNYRFEPCSPDNQPGIKRRISLQLGYPDLRFAWQINLVAGAYQLDFQLLDRSARIWLEGALTLAAADAAAAREQAYRAILRQLAQLDAYAIIGESGQFRLQLNDQAAAELGRHPELLASKAQAGAMQGELLAWAANERLIVVEHLLLRPKFPGDALYPACAEGACRTCGDEDPYSFRLTFVMPGWTTAYKDNMDLRRFAERTIRQETPAHLVGKTCWVGNDGFIEDACAEVVDDLAGLLIAKGLTADGVAPEESDACASARTIYHAFSGVFRGGYEDQALDYLHADALRAQLTVNFATGVKASEVGVPMSLDDALWSEIQRLMIEHFHRLALHGWQFERFEAAWLRWLKVNAAFDWPEERLHARVETLLKAHLLAIPADGTSIRRGAAAILSQYGMSFHAWLDDNLKQGRELAEFSVFIPAAISLPVELSLDAGAAAAIGEMLKERYDAYHEVSYRLWIVGSLLSKLRNVYPGATLHDCDEGSDLNPVRLDNTALGNYPLRATLT
jgi:hypothetical protein